MTRRFTIAVAALLIGIPTVARCGEDEAGRFASCDDIAGAGFFWVDTTSGKTWWADPGKMKWVYCGKPEGASQSANGTFLPRENKNGEGMFVLNKQTGEGWWTNGKEWKTLGKPEDTGQPEK